MTDPGGRANQARQTDASNPRRDAVLRRCRENRAARTVREREARHRLIDPATQPPTGEETNDGE